MTNPPRSLAEVLAAAVKAARLLAQCVPNLPKPAADLLLPSNVQTKGSTIPAPAEWLFELLVLYDALNAASSSHDIVAEGLVGTRIRFLGGPGHKSSATYFKVKARPPIGHFPGLQVVHGTNIRHAYPSGTDETGNTHAPDISIQVENAPLAPTWEHVITIFDAKWRTPSVKTGKPQKLSKKNDLGRVTKPEVAQFLLFCDDLKLFKNGVPPQNVAACGALIQAMGVAFEVPAIISNGEDATYSKVGRIERNVGVVPKYTGPSTQGTPTKAEILKARPSLQALMP